MYKLPPKDARLFSVLGIHRDMVADSRRTLLFREAIFDVVCAGDVVVDIGTGIGILAFFAAAAGARRVYAIEESGIIELAKQIARENKLFDRIIFIRSHSREVLLPQKADVVIAEVIGSFGLEEGICTTIADARNRFLKPGGKLIPSMLNLFIVPVEATELFSQINYWGKHPYGIDFSTARLMALNSMYIESIPPMAFLSEPQRLATFDLTITGSCGMSEQLNFVASRSGVMSGLCGWFDAYLSPGRVLSTSPLEPPTHWQQTFFPIDEPVHLIQGDVVSVKVEYIPTSAEGIWNWEISIPAHNICSCHSTSILVR